jgi:hypothetical protein
MKQMHPTKIILFIVVLDNFFGVRIFVQSEAAGQKWGGQ